MKPSYKSDEEKKAARKASVRSYYLKNKVSIIAKTSALAKKNRTACAANLRAWRERNKDRYLASTKKWEKANPDKMLAKARKNYRTHIQARRMSHRLWTKKNLHRAGHYVAKRRAAGKMPQGANRSLILELYKSRSVGLPVDHIIPLVHGGAHHEMNLQLLPKLMNHSKHANPFWLAPSPSYKDWRDVPRELWPIDLAPKYLELINQNKGVSIRWDSAA